MTINDVAERLREEREKESGQEFEDGKEIGTEWAEREAGYRELEQFTAQADDPRLLDIWVPDGLSDTLYADPMASEILGLENTPPEADENGRGGYRLPSDHPFVRGLLEGAAEVWNQAQPRLR